MERLSKKCAELVRQLKSCLFTVIWPELAGNAATAIQLLDDRLAYYEDLEEQGRLVVLPCRIDTTVYDIRRFYKGRKVVRQEIVSGEIDHFTIGEAGNVITTVCLHGNEWADYELNDLLLTKEDAERALKEAHR